MTMTDEARVSPGPEISVGSLPARLRDLAAQHPERVALREKVFGIWEATTYAGYWEMVQVVGAALLELGVEAGDKIAIHSENRKAWVWADLGGQAIGAASVGIYPTNPAAEVEYLLGHSEAGVLIAEDQEQVDKALEVRERLPGLRTIVYLEPRGVRSYDHPDLMYWDDFVELGRRRLAANPDEVRRLVELGEATEIMENPYHPYTKALISAIPVPDPDVERSRKRIVLEGDPPSPLFMLGAAERPRAEMTEVSPGHFASDPGPFLEERNMLVGSLD